MERFFLTCFNGGEALSFRLYQCRYGRGHSSGLEELVLMVVLVILVINSLVA